MEKTRILGKTEDHRKRGRPNRSWLDSIKEAIFYESEGAEQGCRGQDTVDILIHRVTRS